MNKQIVLKGLYSYYKEDEFNRFGGLNYIKNQKYYEKMVNMTEKTELKY